MYELTSIIKAGSIAINYDELETTALQQTAHYQGLVITEEEVKEIKKIRAEMNKIIDRISAERIRIKKEYNQPVAEMEEKIKSVLNIIGAARDNLDEQIKFYENEKRQARKAIFEDAYRNDPIEGVLFGQVYDPRWENESTSMRDALEQYTNKIQRINGDLATLRRLPQEQHSALAIEHYKKVLDVVQALSYADDTMRLFSAANVAAPMDRVDTTEDHNFLLGMEIKLDVAGTKQEYFTINLRTEQDYLQAINLLDIMGIPYVK